MVPNGGTGQVPCQLGVDAGEDRQHLKDQKEHHRGHQNQHHRGVDHGAAQFFLQGVLALVVGGQPLEDLFGAPGDLAHLHHVAQIVGETARCPQGGGEGVGLFQTVQNPPHPLLKGAGLHVLAKELQRLAGRDAGPQHHG